MHIWQRSRLNIRGIGGVEKHIACVSERLKKAGHVVHIGQDCPFEPDIIHTHGDLFVNFREKRFPKAKWIHIFHGTSLGRLLSCHEYLSLSGWKGVAKETLLAEGSTAAIAVGENAFLEARRYFRYRKPLKLIPNGADPEIFKPLSSLTEIPRFIFVGRAQDRVKNFENIVSGFLHVLREHPKAELWLAPGGENLPLTKHPQVSHLGPLDSAALSEKLSQCRALILCSFYEGDPIVLHEAQAIGLPVIVSKISAIEKSLEGYAHAFFANHQNGDSIAQAMLRAIDPLKPITPQPRIRTWDEVVQEFEGFYRA